MIRQATVAEMPTESLWHTVCMIRQAYNFRDAHRVPVAHPWA